jgi:hypothetical protein
MDVKIWRSSKNFLSYKRNLTYGNMDHMERKEEK